jgi:hypothetical protein
MGSQDQHRDWDSRKMITNTMVRQLYPSAVWVMGQGEYATLARCRYLTIMLHPTEEQAQHELDVINKTGCGGDCINDHELVNLGARW